MSKILAVAFDTSYLDVDTAAMATKTKRTYNLSPTTVHRVRELADLPGVARSQDEVVELAVERFYLEVRAREEELLWEEAASDPSFKTEMGAVAHDFRDSEAWPQ
jgi:hypothetical protein